MFIDNLAMASLEELRKTRTIKKILVTKRVNELRRLVVDDACRDVGFNFDSIKGIIKAHDEYHDNLTDTDILASDRYFCGVQLY